MLKGFVGGLVVAWILSWFNVDHMIAQGLWEVFRLHISPATYYIGLGLIGLIGGAFNR